MMNYQMRRVIVDVEWLLMSEEHVHAHLEVIMSVWFTTSESERESAFDFTLLS